MNNLYLIYREEVDSCYDVYDSAIVSAEDEQEARETHPDKGVSRDGVGWVHTYVTLNGIVVKDKEDLRGWVKFEDIDEVFVEYLGKTEKPSGAISASFNAG